MAGTQEFPHTLWEWSSCFVLKVAGQFWATETFLYHFKYQTRPSYEGGCASEAFSTRTALRRWTVHRSLLCRITSQKIQWHLGLRWLMGAVLCKWWRKAPLRWSSLPLSEESVLHTGQGPAPIVSGAVPQAQCALAPVRCCCSGPWQSVVLTDVVCFSFPTW